VVLNFHTHGESQLSFSKNEGRNPASVRLPRDKKNTIMKEEGLKSRSSPEEEISVTQGNALKPSPWREGKRGPKKEGGEFFLRKKRASLTFTQENRDRTRHCKGNSTKRIRGRIQGKKEPSRLWGRNGDYLRPWRDGRSRREGSTTREKESPSTFYHSAEKREGGPAAGVRRRGSDRKER